jgi:hypothetical protein
VYDANNQLVQTVPSHSGATTSRKTSHQMVSGDGSLLRDVTISVNNCFWDGLRLCQLLNSLADLVTITHKAAQVILLPSSSTHIS